MCPTSMPRAIFSLPLPEGLGSPSTTLRRSAATGPGHVALPVDPGEMHVLLVRAAHEVRERERRMVGVHRAPEPDHVRRSPGSVPVAPSTRSALAMRSGLATPGSFCALTAFSS